MTASVHRVKMCVFDNRYLLSFQEHVLTYADKPFTYGNDQLGTSSDLVTEVGPFLNEDAHLLNPCLVLCGCT